MTAVSQREATELFEEWRISEPSFVADEWRPGLASSPWSGHRLFAYDLVRNLAPRRIVELGTHWGCSLFAFAQAIQNGGLPSELFAIDTWEGDENTGFYGEEVYAWVKETLASCFPDLPVHLMRMTFDEALPEFKDSSIDVLHIDGLHAYDAARHDFETWLPKLAPNGVVLFHDVAESTGYGSSKYWSEISQEHPSYAFEHSFGLGILFPKGDAVLQRLDELSILKILPYYETRSMLTLREIQIRDHERMVDERDAYIKKLEGDVDERNAWLEDLNARAEESDTCIKTLEQRVDALLELETICATLRAEQSNLSERYEAEKLALRQHTEKLLADLGNAKERAQRTEGAFRRQVAELRESLASQEALIEQRTTYIRHLEVRLARARKLLRPLLDLRAFAKGLTLAVRKRGS
jgi:hypothetical protein